MRDLYIYLYIGGTLLLFISWFTLDSRYRRYFILILFLSTTLPCVQFTVNTVPTYGVILLLDWNFWNYLYFFCDTCKLKLSNKLVELVVMMVEMIMLYQKEREREIMFWNLKIKIKKKQAKYTYYYRPMMIGWWVVCLFDLVGFGLVCFGVSSFSQWSSSLNTCIFTFFMYDEQHN